MEQILRRLTNNIRILEHATCTAGGGVIGLEDDIPLMADELGIQNSLENELRTLRRLSDDISEAAADFHEKMGALAVLHDVELPTDRLVNTGGGGKGP